MSQQNQEIIIRSHAKLNQDNIDEALADFAVDATNHGFKIGREGFKLALEDIYRTFPDCAIEILEAVAEGETVVARAMMRGTHLGVGQIPLNGGMLVGVAPTGKSFAVEHIHWYKLRDGKVIEHYAVRDDLGMMQQLGLLPQTFSASSR